MATIGAKGTVHQRQILLQNVYPKNENETGSVLDFFQNKTTIELVSLALL